MDLKEAEARDDSADESQQQFSRPTVSLQPVTTRAEEDIIGIRYQATASEELRRINMYYSEL
jgi:hypothetical protein